MLNKNVIKEMPADTLAGISRILLRPKPLGFREIIYLTKINKLLTVKLFVMDTPEVIRRAMFGDM